METVLLELCYLMSCFICVFLTAQFLGERYQRRYPGKWLYVGVYSGISVAISGINYLQIATLNYVAWVVAVGGLAYVMYEEKGERNIKRVLETETFFITIAFTETLGVLLGEWLVQSFSVQMSPTLFTCLKVMGSKAIIVGFYYMVVRPFVAEPASRYSRRLYLTFLAILLYSSVNLLVIVSGFFQKLDVGTLAINLACIVFVDLYLLSFLKSSDESRQHEEEMAALKQQARLQYEYYAQQEQKYNETIQILHDVNKHIQTINELSVTGNAASARDYAEQIRNTLKPLIPVSYTDNPILNILLTDKRRQARDRGIKLEVNLGCVSFNFMEAIDITTIFGNLLDNAIEACEAAHDVPGKEIVLGARQIQEMVSVTMENTSNPVVWKGDAPVSEKGENRGIGLLNVRRSIDKYDGSLKLREERGRFIAEFFINR